MKLEGIGHPLYPENLLMASEAAKYLLPREVVSNLTKGTPIVTNSDQYGELKPYFYGDDFISAVAGYVIGEQTLYSSEQFRYNSLQFLQTFGLPEDLYVFSGKPIQSHRVRMHRRQIVSPNFYTVDTIPEHGRKDRIFMHGRFNGFPHPAVIETLINLRADHPTSEIWCGVDTDKTSIAKGQNPFMDPLFRTTALKITGLIDNFILLDPPTDEDKEAVAEYWRDFYHISPDSLDARIIVMLYDELSELKVGQSSWRHVFYDPENERTVGDIHQTTLKNGTYPLNQLRKDWEIIRERLAELHKPSD